MTLMDNAEWEFMNHDLDGQMNKRVHAVWPCVSRLNWTCCGLCPIIITLTPWTLTESPSCVVSCCHTVCTILSLATARSADSSTGFSIIVQIRVLFYYVHVLYLALLKRKQQRRRKKEENKKTVEKNERERERERKKKAETKLTACILKQDQYTEKAQKNAFFKLGNTKHVQTFSATDRVAYCLCCCLCDIFWVLINSLVCWWQLKEKCLRWISVKFRVKCVKFRVKWITRFARCKFLFLSWLIGYGICLLMLRLVLITFVESFFPLSSGLTALLSHVILNEWLAFDSVFWISIKVVYLQLLFSCYMVGATWNCCCLGMFSAHHTTMQHAACFQWEFTHVLHLSN